MQESALSEDRKLATPTTTGLTLSCLTQWGAGQVYCIG